ncbi:MAG: HupE/UreJ family protein [Planctomycetes bacterium]|nr:HupE/UreJ family protein [Planctomycetota bacterium]MCP4771358.1 HupE/UreJ family protein [Planctomycetota bacterium]MCP4861795.1 HupE/UreJ family protein [Planctomycetota bacterium]
MPSLIALCAVLLAALPAVGVEHVLPEDEFGITTEHPAALSLLDLRFTDNVIELQLRMQELTLREVPRWLLDTDLSGTISNFEFEEGFDRVAAMIEESMWLEFDGQIEYPEWVIKDYEGLGETHADGSVHFDYVVLTATLPRPDSLQAASIHSDLFLEDGNPKHTLVINVSGMGADSINTLLKGEDRDYDFTIPSATRVLGQYVVLGWEHVLIGYDHLAFLLALLFGVACLADLLWAVTAFTLAHSITLALAAFDIFSLPPIVVEPGISLSVLVVLVWHLRRGSAKARPWIPAFVFGLLHGFGFAGVLSEIGLPAGSRAISLFGFNLGVELGQLTFVLPAVALIVLIRSLSQANKHEKLRELAALPSLAFAMLLVGNVVVNFWFESAEGSSARWIALAFGSACCTILCFLPGGDSDKVRALRRLSWQAGLLFLFFTLGQQLRA